MFQSVNKGVLDLEEKILTEKALALIGIYDEFSDLYFSIASVFENSFNELKNRSHRGIVSLSQIEKYSRTRIRTLLNEFLIKHTYLFTKDYEELHPNSMAMNSLRLIQVKQIGASSLEYQMVPFNAFVNQFEEFVLNVIFQRKSYNDVAINYDSVKRELLDHVNSIVNSCMDKIKVKESSKQIDVQELIVFKNLSVISCNKNQHIVNSDVIIIPLLNSDEFVRLPVHKCDTCGKIFIGNETLRIYEKIFGKMIVSVRKDFSSEEEYREFLGESNLHKAGYNVVEGNMSQSERRKLLIKLLETEMLTDFQIRKDIENAIRIFKGVPRFERAVKKWQSDLFFISEYMKENL